MVYTTTEHSVYNGWLPMKLHSLQCAVYIFYYSIDILFYKVTNEFHYDQHGDFEIDEGISNMYRTYFDEYNTTLSFRFKCLQKGFDYALLSHEKHVSLIALANKSLGKQLHIETQNERNNLK